MADSSEPPGKRLCIFRPLPDADVVPHEPRRPVFISERAMVFAFVRERVDMRMCWTEDVYCNAYDCFGLSFRIGDNRHRYESGLVQFVMASAEDTRWVYMDFGLDQNGDLVLYAHTPTVITSMGRVLVLYPISINVRAIYDCTQRPVHVREVWDKLGLEATIFDEVMLPYLDPVDGFRIVYNPTERERAAQ